LKNVTSFISEHTVGLSIAPILKKILNKEYNHVAPMFPWMSREGGSVSKYLHEADKFKIVGLYPRRPKILISDEENLYLKINEQIILGAQCGSDLGIPIIGGFPVVRNFWELSQTPNCLWIKLNFELNENKLFQINHKNATCTNEELTKRVLGSNQAVLDFINSGDKFFDIDEAIEAFKKIKMVSSNLEYYSSFAYMGGYKPIYFLIR